ncbi:VacJ family lipoprotein [Ideonella sp.]|uniref:MlaA family lipoprotein n=1 Tax=Ideonella sp. TaxID=1929293 RepID=UPI0035AE240A
MSAAPGARGLAAGLVLAAALAAVTSPSHAQAPAPLAPAAAASAAGTDAPPSPTAAPRSPRDPLEPWNRSVFSFNEALDAAVLKPVATAYRDWVPEYLRGLVDNVFGNVADAWSAINHLLQGKVESGLQMGFRVVVNTGLGFGGLLDIGTEIGLDKQPEDFGQTLGRWGMPSGPYLVLPLLGPSTVRDTAALPVDMQASPSALVDDTRARVLAVTLLNVVNTRANLLGASRVLDDIALDKYSFLRDAYLARRQNQVHDGNPPEEPAEDDEPAPPPAAASEPAAR